MSGFRLPTPTSPSSSACPRIILLYFSRSCSRRRSSSVLPSASKTCSLADGWCFLPNLPRPLMSILGRYLPFVTHDCAVAPFRQRAATSCCVQTARERLTDDEL